MPVFLQVHRLLLHLQPVLVPLVLLAPQLVPVRLPRNHLLHLLVLLVLQAHQHLKVPRVLHRRVNHLHHRVVPVKVHQAPLLQVQVGAHLLANPLQRQVVHQGVRLQAVVNLQVLQPVLVQVALKVRQEVVAQVNHYLKAPLYHHHEAHQRVRLLKSLNYLSIISRLRE